MTTGSVSISDNTVSGDLAARDIYKTTYINANTTTAMTKLVEQYMAETLADKTLTDWTEKLEHFMSNEVNPDVRSLEEKLTVAGRSDLITSALKRKQAAYKAIMRQQGSRSAQTIYTFLMADIVVNFEQSVLPLVQASAPRNVVDTAMLEKVITPAVALLEQNPLMLDKMDIQSLVYFLAGNCYIRWDAC
ncbi:ABC-three component system protein [Herbaspirillum sp.]|uniref:ABC-three component system protein n=1 Tax=Herbaspirillum sp. TaxID=1890675 RepID=UPI0031CF65BE